jgi:hypothetical protein
VSLPQPSSQLRNVFAGYYLLLFNYLVKLVAAITATITKPWNVRVVTHADSPVTAAPNDVILANTTGGAIAVTGPATSGAQWAVKKISADGNAVNVSASAGNIDALATQVIAIQWGSYLIAGNGAGASIIAQK